jgi:hypothetical protein
MLYLNSNRKMKDIDKKARVARKSVNHVMKNIFEV